MSTYVTSCIGGGLDPFDSFCLLDPRGQTVLWVVADDPSTLGWHGSQQHLQKGKGAHLVVDQSPDSITTPWLPSQGSAPQGGCMARLHLKNWALDTSCPGKDDGGRTSNISPDRAGLGRQLPTTSQEQRSRPTRDPVRRVTSPSANGLPKERSLQVTPKSQDLAF